MLMGLLVGDADDEDLALSAHYLTRVSIRVLTPSLVDEIWGSACVRSMHVCMYGVHTTYMYACTGCWCSVVTNQIPLH